MKLSIKKTVPVDQTARVLQLSGLFDIPPTAHSMRTWELDFPLEDQDWNIGLIVGPSGSGKTTVAREVFGKDIVAGYSWPETKSVVDGFPAGLSIKDITASMSSVGFSSPPSWLRPFHCLSNGEQFRVTLARALVSAQPLVAFDEFTSFVDRTVAQIGSAAVAKSVRRAGRKFIAVACHYDIMDWLQPDWVLEMPAGEFTRRSLRPRPTIDLEVARVHYSAWQLFKSHHYMSADIHRGAYCFLASWQGRPVAFAAVLHFPHAVRPGWREHRVVTLPDFQGVGIGNALSEYCGSLFKATGKPYRCTTSQPAMAHHRMRSKLWQCTRAPGLVSGIRSRSSEHGLRGTESSSRLTMSFEYIGPTRPAEARAFGLSVK